VKANYEKYRKMGFNVVGLSFDRSADAWKRAIRENHLDWVHLSDLKFWQSVAAEVYTIHSIPSSILVDPTGKIVAVDLRGDRLGKKLAEIYGY
jgi:peroxiredoxin